MKKTFIAILALAMIGLVTTSCQNDSDNGSQKLNKNSPLTTMLLRVTHGSLASAGKSGDDDTPCFLVNLPVSLLINGQTVTVSSFSDYALVQNALHHSGDSDDDDDDDDDDDEYGSFIFPISLTFADGMTQQITNETELDVAIHSCGDDLDDIECVDVQYPLTITFTDANNVTSVITLNNDDETYTFLATLGATETLVINYPLSITNATGTTLVINNNDEFLEALQAADDHCDEGDDDGDDDDGKKGA